MKKYLTQALGACAALIMLATACKKDETQAVISPSNQPTLTASASTVVLTQANADQPAVTFTWTPVTSDNLSGTDKSFSPAKAYQLQFAKPGTNFAKPVSLDAGAGPTTVVKVAALNNALQTLGLTAGTAAPVEVRLNANYASNFVWASPSVTLTATTYSFCEQPDPKQAWTIIGQVGPGADWSTDYTMTYDCTAKTFSYTNALKVGAYKFRYGADWTANLGGASSTGGALIPAGPDLKITTAGTYTIVLTPGPIGADGKATGGTFTIK